MKMVYVAANGDGVGEQIGNAILSDDHKALSSLSRKFKDVHSNLEKWVQKKGGEVVASSGDEIIFSIPEKSLSEIESLREKYSQSAGTTLTMGIGQTISQASKALIYGKMNDKNQVVQYEPKIDDYISNSDEEEIPSPEQLEESASDEGRFEEGAEDEPSLEPTDSDESSDNEESEDGGFEQEEFEENPESSFNSEDSADEEGDEFQNEDDEESELPEEENIASPEEDEDNVPELSPEDIASPEEEEGELPEEEDIASPEEDEDDDMPFDYRQQDQDESDEDFSNQEDFSEDQDEDTAQIDVPKDEVDGDYGSEEMAENQPEHEQDMDEDEEFIHDAQENRADEADDDIVEADKEPEVFGRQTEEGEDDLESLGGDDEDFSQAPEEDEEQASDDEDSEKEQFFNQGIHSDENDNEDEDLDDLPQDWESALKRQPHVVGDHPAYSENMSTGDEPDESLNEDQDQFDENQMSQDMPEESEEAGPETQELKQKIFSSLQSIKQNKPILDQIQASNPDLYQGIISNIQSMIEMGRKLGLSSQEGIDQEMGGGGLPPQGQALKKPQGGFQA